MLLDLVVATMRPAVPELDSRESLATYLGSYTDRIDEKVGIFLGYPKTASEFDIIYERRACERFASASVIKLVIQYALYADYDGDLEKLRTVRSPSRENCVGGSGVLNLFDNPTLTLEDLARAMIAISDNTATNELIDVLGWGRINDSADTLGMSQTALQRKMMVGLEETCLDSGENVHLPNDHPVNVTSPRDCARFFADFVHRETLSCSAYDRMKVPLRNRNFTEMFPRYIPSEIELCHKTGFLPTAALDTGVLFADNPLVFSVFVDQTSRDSDGADIIAEIGDAVYTFLQ